MKLLQITIPCSLEFLKSSLFVDNLQPYDSFGAKVTVPSSPSNLTYCLLSHAVINGIINTISATIAIVLNFFIFPPILLNEFVCGSITSQLHYIIKKQNSFKNYSVLYFFYISF